MSILLFDYVYVNKSLKFQINGREVCKVFRICSGIKERMFNESVREVLR